ncbi:transcriptional regulator [Paenibacillus larvae]|uniref:transcriptional regulator n=1 Tax=Paenibacillus larvae TaxID=1464 RepID=UPI00288E32A9|nr:transcriptional regulator [Paenibacillus larvae]MDT2269149.1 transcriptional regulator [Paenibacillus larvae]
MSSNCFLPERIARKLRSFLASNLKNIVYSRQLPLKKKKLTSIQLSGLFHGPTNVTSDQTANIAIYNIDVPAARKAHIQRIDRAVARLHPKEQLLIRERYLKMIMCLIMSSITIFLTRLLVIRAYAKIRWKAFYGLALALNIAVEKSNNFSKKFLNYLLFRYVVWIYTICSCSIGHKKERSTNPGA